LETLEKNHLTNTLGSYFRQEGNITKFGWVVLAMLIAEDLTARLISTQARPEFGLLAAQLLIWVAFILAGVLKIKLSPTKNEAESLIYRVAKYLEIAIMAIFLSMMYHGFIFYFVVLLPISSIILSRGFKESVPFILLSWLTQALSQFIVLNAFSRVNQQGVFSHDLMLPIAITAQYLLFTCYGYILGRVQREYVRSQEENQILIDRLGDKYVQLEQAKKEIQSHYEKIIQTNEQLEEANNKLTASLAEFYTLQQISQAISSIFDMNELLKFVNDVIIGVMGVSHSTIALCHGPQNHLKVQVSSIFNKKELAIVSDYINSDVLKPAVKDGHSMIDNQVDPDEYPFTRGRKIQSLICVPLIAKGNVLGIVLIEHSLPNAFHNDNVRLLEIIAQQVSIAIENARLYQQMHDLATLDGLTGAYNRLYFQDNLQIEFKKAQEGNYDLSILMFDIDHFKRINDTHGHLFGDLVLKSIAAFIKKKLRKEDIFARYGGEEFVILMPHTTLEQVVEKAEDIRTGVSAMIISDRVISASVTISIGVSSFPLTADSQMNLVKSADDALYEAKRQGRNRVCVAHKKTGSMEEDTAG